jgi:tetratricopeptide (TPR) repeat protein
MSGTGRFKVYDIKELRGKIPSILLENYLDDFDNIELIAHIAGLHMSCGNFDLGIRMLEDIVEKVRVGEDNMRETNIVVWNLYILSKVYIEQEKFDKAYRALDTAERYWSKDLALYDTTGIYRVRNKEDLWLRRAFGYLCQGRKNDFESVIDRVMLSRYELYNKAYEITGETPVRDGCLLDCFEYSSYMCRNLEDLKHAIVFIKTALRYLGRVPRNNDYIEGKLSEKNGDLKNAYTYYLRFYLTNRPQFFYETLIYGTCRSCAYFETQGGTEGECKKLNIAVEQHKSCSRYVGLPLGSEAE